MLQLLCGHWDLRVTKIHVVPYFHRIYLLMKEKQKRNEQDVNAIHKIKCY